MLNFSLYAIFVAPFLWRVRLRDMTRQTDPIPIAFMMTRHTHNDLSRRERQIIDILYAQGKATAAEVQAALPDPPSYSAVRAMLRILEDKRHVRHEQDGPRYVYVPTVGRDNAKRSALHHVLKTFFDGSTEQAISALLDDSAVKLSDAELDRLARLIDQARNTGA
jgi:predicted transcriptional regulator